MFTAALFELREEISISEESNGTICFFLSHRESEDMGTGYRIRESSVKISVSVSILFAASIYTSISAILFATLSCASSRC